MRRARPRALRVAVKPFRLGFREVSALTLTHLVVCGVVGLVAGAVRCQDPGVHVR